MPAPSDWTTAFPEWLAAARAARTHEPFDDAGRAREVQNHVSAAGKFSYWPALIGVMAAGTFPNGWVWMTLGVAVFGVGIWRARIRRAATTAEMQLQTDKLRAAHVAKGRALEITIGKAELGEVDAIRVLLQRWQALVHDSLSGITLEAVRQPDGSFAVGGRGINRDDVPALCPRIGRGGRTFYDKRKAAEIDEDLVEWNAGAIYAALTAMFGGTESQRVAVRLTIVDGEGKRIPWITLGAKLDRARLSYPQGLPPRPSYVISQLGADIGRCRNQRYTAAKEPSWSSSDAYSAAIAAERMTDPTARAKALDAARNPPPPPPAIAFPDPASATRRRSVADSMEARSSGVMFGSPVRVASAAQSIPHAPPGFKSTLTISISGSNFGGDFAAEAKKRATMIGDPHAPFVPFQTYWSTYAQMDAAQTKFYFRWRSAARNGQYIPTELSYIFIHVYELLHVIGAKNASDAAQQLTRVWQGYRTTFPKLDNYLVPWITDLYATEVSATAALDFVQRHIDIHTPQGDELMLATDSRWIAGEYDRMTPAGLAMLLAERRLGDNKFVREHNVEMAGQPWVEGAYRAAIKAADVAHQERTGHSPRDTTIRGSGGLRIVSRPAFMSAVYSWNRKEVKLGKVPALSERSHSVALYRSVTRHAENLLRKERGFSGRLRGVELSPQLTAAIEERIAAYIRATKPRAKVTIDVARAEQLAQESVDTRARLLQGLNEESGETTTANATRADGLLTDVDQVATVMHALSAPAEALMVAFVDAGWEVAEHDESLLRASGGVLIGPLVDEVNGHAREVLGTELIVRENEHLIVQEDYRDEVYFLVRGDLDGFTPTLALPEEAPHVPPAALQAFGPVELQTLLAVARGGGDLLPTLVALAGANGSTPLMLVDRLNEAAVDSTYGDILVDADASPPAILEDAEEFVSSILAHLGLPTSETS